MPTTDDIRRCVMALPEVEETSHFKFKVPLWKVRGKTFLGMVKDETAAVFCVSEPEADEAAAADPGTYAAVRRLDSRRSFLGLQAQLSGISADRVTELAGRAWRQHAPKRLAAEHADIGAGRPG